MRERPNQQGDNVGLQKNARRSPRLQPDEATCNLGEVLDLSTTGIRLRTRCLQLHSKHQLTLTCCNFKIGPVSARVVWTRKVGMLKYESGLEFIDLDEAASKALARLVILSRDQRSM